MSNTSPTKTALLTLPSPAKLKLVEAVAKVTQPAPLSSLAKAGSVTALVLEAIETPETPPVPLGLDALLEGYQPRRYRDHALRLMDTRGLDRRSWLAIRQSGIGSSDASAAIGLNPYKSQLELWLEKTGRSTTDLEPQGDEKLTSPLHWGQVLEPIVAEHYAQHTGFKVQRVNAILQHVDHPWMLANLDREIISNSQVQLLECKTAGQFGAKLWKDGVPEYVQIQVMHQLAVTGQQAADVAVLIAGHELQIHRIERDETMIQQLIQLEQQFWDCVENDTPPPADGSDSADKALRLLFSHDKGEAIHYLETDPLSQTFAQLQEVRLILDKAEKEEALLKQTIQQAMGEASQATFPTGKVTWRLSKNSTRLDSKKLQTDFPKLCAPYLKEVAGSRRFVVSKAANPTDYSATTKT